MIITKILVLSNIFVTVDSKMKLFLPRSINNTIIFLVNTIRIILHLLNEWYIN